MSSIRKSSVFQVLEIYSNTKKWCEVQRIKVMQNYACTSIFLDYITVESDLDMDATIHQLFLVVSWHLGMFSFDDSLGSSETSDDILDS
jgi:hypothetical protein